MKSKKAMALLAMTLAASAGLWAQELPRLGVVEFSTNSGAEKTKQDAITVRNLVESKMVATRKYQVITRDEIDKLLANQRIQVSSISSEENVKKLQLQNISYIVTGSVDAMGTDYAVTVKILDVSTGQFSHSGDDFMSGASRDLYSGVGALIDKFIAGMSSQGGQIVQTEQGGSTGRYKIGGTGPGGGIVFYDKGNKSGGWQYLEAAPQSTEFKASWSDANTRCNNLIFGGFENWVLPDKNQLDWMYQNLKQKGLGGFSNSWYWSSSQDYTYGAWFQHFGDGGQNSYNKGSTGSVRAVRAF